MADGGLVVEHVEAGQAKKALARIEAPFADVQPEVMRWFMRIAYSAVPAADVVKQLADSLDFLTELVRLADQLSAPGMLAALDPFVARCLPTGEAAVDAERLMALLALADGHREQLPKTYQSAVDAAVRAIVRSCTGSHPGDPPLQRMLADTLFGCLSHQTLGIVLQSVASTVRSVTRVEELATVAPKLAPMQRGRAGSFTWEWRPGFGVEDARATQPQYSPVFSGGGAQWQIKGYLNDIDASSRGHISFFLCPHSEPASVAGRKAEISIVC